MDCGLWIVALKDIPEGSLHSVNTFLGPPVYRVLSYVCSMVVRFALRLALM